MPLLIRDDVHDVSTISITRFSMDEFYEQHKGKGEREIDGPPEYESAVLSCRRFNIQPREDEGREELPPYSSAISLESVFMRKNELESAVHRSPNRNWSRVFVALQGTALTFHKYKGGRLLDLGSRRQNPDLPVEGRKGAFLKSYNLQHADVGIAADYLKKKYVIRVRAETDQFLISCTTIETFVQWLQSLFAAIDLAPPLDDREIPKDISIPRVRRRGCVRFTGDVRNAALIREQTRIMRRHFPHLIDEIPDSTASSTPLASRSTLASEQGESTEPGLRVTRSEGPPMQQQRLSPPVGIRRAQTAPAAPMRPSIDSDGKWHPDVHWTQTHDMMYAKRCMAVLTHRSPRKTNFVIMKGQRYIVDWRTGRFSLPGQTAVAPPEYGKIEGSLI